MIEGNEVPLLEVERGDVLCIIADCSTKKSLQIRRWLQKMLAENAELRVLVVSVRVIHAENTTHELNDAGLDFKCYKDAPKRNEDGVKYDVHWSHPRHVCSLESLHHCKTKEFDVVVLDETRALVANFDSKTLWENEKVNALENIKTLARLVGKSSYVIAACADGRYDGGFNALVRGVAGTRRIVVWDVLGKKLVRSLKVQYTGGSPGEKAIVMVHASNEPPSEFEQALVAYKESFGDPRGRARVAIACSSKQRARDYGKLCEKLGLSSDEYEIYSSDTSDELKKKHFADPDLSWENVGCLIFTGSLSVAVDPRKTTFGKLFIHTMRGGTQLRDQFQSICRFGRFEGGLFDTAAGCVCFESGV